MAKIRYLGRQSSMAPEGGSQNVQGEGDMNGVDEKIGDVIRLLCSASQGDVEGVKSVLATGIPVNSSDFDKRTALHVAACEGQKEIVQLLIAQGADVNAQDRWGSTPLADANHYNCEEVAQILIENGGELPKTSPMRVSSTIEVPEYDIDRAELNLQPTVDSHAIGKWRGTKVFVKIISMDMETEKDKLREFINELSLMLKLRHPSVVQFLGAVTQSLPVMLVMEYLQKGDLQNYLTERGKPLKPKKALKFALDIARGLNYVHEFKPEPIIHGNVKPSNLLRDKAGHLKITDFAFTSVVPDKGLATKNSGRYMAPELFLRNECGVKVDVFSFALILQEMMEGVCPFPKLDAEEAAKSYADGKRPCFKVKPRYYPEGLKELIEECWNQDPNKRPPFKVICKKLEDIKANYSTDSFKACITKVRYSKLCGR